MLIRNGKQATVSAGYSFYADPLFSVDGKFIRLEALNSLNGLGEVLEIDANTLKGKSVLMSGEHFSYPYSFELNGEEYLLPEVASHSSPYALKNPFNVDGKINLKGLESYRIVDGTLIVLNGTLFLFCSMNSNSSDCLYLFYSSGIDKEFYPHSLNPIVIDPLRARMGGRLSLRNGKYYRFGQDNSYGYGDGVSICEITKLTTSEYEEKVVGSLRFNDASGPHTVDVSSETSVFDFYIDKFSLLASYRRVVPRILRRFR